MKDIIFVDPDLLTTARANTIRGAAIRDGAQVVIVQPPHPHDEWSLLHDVLHANWRTATHVDHRAIDPAKSINLWLDFHGVRKATVLTDNDEKWNLSIIEGWQPFDTAKWFSDNAQPRTAYLVGPARVIDSNSMTVEDAIAEAQRQAKKNPGKLFQVVAVVAQCIGEVEVKTTNHPVG